MLEMGSVSTGNREKYNETKEEKRKKQKAWIVGLKKVQRNQVENSLLEAIKANYVLQISLIIFDCFCHFHLSWAECSSEVMTAGE